MWMEEHIGKRINHERVDEALATNATTIATACPFCRVMVTDGVNDRQEEAGRSGVEVLDVAQVLLGSLDYDKAKLPAKGTAAAEITKTAGLSPAKPTESEAPAPEKSTQAAASAAPAKGIRLAAGAKQPDAKKPVSQTTSAKATEAPAATVPVKGLGIAGGAKRPGAKKSPDQAETPAPTESKSEAKPEPSDHADGNPAPPTAPVKRLGITRSARPPGKH